MSRLVIVLLAFLASAAATAQTPPAYEPGTTVLHLSEFAERVMRQDRLTIQLRAEVIGSDATRVQAEINRRMTSALERARAVPAVRAETRGYWVHQERPQNAPMRWRGQQILALISSDPGAALALAGELQENGLVMAGMQFDLEPKTARAAEDDLTAEALKRLRERAARVAAAMDLTVRNMRDLRVGQVGGQMPPRPMMMRTEAMAAGAAAAPAGEAGETTVRVSVDAEVILVRRN